MAHDQTTKYGADDHTIYEPSRARGDGTSYLQAGDPSSLDAALRTGGISTARGSTASDLVRALLHDSSTPASSQHDGQRGLRRGAPSSPWADGRTRQLEPGRASYHARGISTPIGRPCGVADGGLVPAVEMGAQHGTRRGPCMAREPDSIRHRVNNSHSLFEIPYNDPE